MVAVTGSVGKTTTKEMLRGALAAFGNTHAATASYNNHWGVPLMLARMPETAKFGVFVYLIARGHKMGEHAVADAKARDEAAQAYIRQAAGTSGTSTAEELTKLACANMQDFVGDDDVTLSIASLNQSRAAAIQEYTVEHYTEGQGEQAKPVKKIKLKLADKLRALELLGSPLPLDQPVASLSRAA